VAASRALLVRWVNDSLKVVLSMKGDNGGFLEGSRADIVANCDGNTVCRVGVLITETEVALLQGRKADTDLRYRLPRHSGRGRPGSNRG
jgi:hypothetical protein